jgi:galactofuranosylgalactofuranosylrhamnosyl-N-acetylglucosaminyl-diphospho-decaprenol beta-1,5/1,6-galactofuranosyltransferase
MQNLSTKKNVSNTKIEENSMHVIGRIKLPQSAEVSSLYVQCNEAVSIDYNKDSPEIVLCKGGIVSSNSYFNSFYEKFYVKYTSINSIYYLLKLEGDFQVSIYREVYGKDNKELILTDKFESCHLSDFVKLRLPNLVLDENSGRIYFEIMCLSKGGVFKEGLIATEQNQNREVSLGIISCTFRKEAYIKNTVNSILKDKFLQEKDFKIFVVDNGKTLSEDDFGDARVKLIPNRNVGGSGGFTRGLIEALAENHYSHFLFMDDDIELETESIYRLFSLYEYAKVDFVVAGSMLDFYRKHVLYEAGAIYGKFADSGELGPFSVLPLKHNLALKDSNSLNLLLEEDNITYGAFWFFAFSKKVIEEIGLPMPYFIKIDDVEFGLRIKERLGLNAVAFPGIAVWHEPFYAKFPVWDIYYIHRNSLITDVIHTALGYIEAIKITTIGLILTLSIFDYNTTEMVIKAFEDYLKGPDFLKNNDPESLHSHLVKNCKRYKSQTIQPNYSPPERVYDKSQPRKFKKIISLLTLNGHLLPNFLTTDKDVFIWHGPDTTGQRSKAFAKKRVLMYKEEGGYLFQNEIDRAAGIKLLARWFKIAATSSVKWASVSKAWKNAASEMTSTVFWQQYLGIKK